MRIYVATKFENSPAAREAYEALKADGHEISHDWTWENSAGLEGEVREVYITDNAEKDTSGVLTANGFLILNYEKIAGGNTEFGMAIAKKRLGHKMCLVAIDAFHEDKPRNIFFHLYDVIHAKDLTEARAIFKQFQVLLDRSK